MTETTVTLRRLDPADGYVLTNGRDYFPDGLYLGKNDSPDNWHEITDAEYEAIVAKKAEEDDHV